MQAIWSIFAAVNSIPSRWRNRLGWVDRPPRVFRIGLKAATTHAFQRTLHRIAGEPDMVVSGAFGEIMGSVSDDAVLDRYAREGTWCPVENAFFADFFARHGGGTYIDIGANIGLTTIPVARNPKVLCLAFEPEPANFRYLRRNVALNCGTNVDLFSLALLDRRGRMALELSPADEGGHRVRLADGGSRGETEWPVVQVDVERLDDALAGRDLAMPLAAKIVAQGAEAHIVAGGRRTLAQAAAMVVEIYPSLLHRMQADVGFLLDFVAEHFCHATMIEGGSTAEAPVWEPVVDVVEAIQAWMARGAAQPFDTVRVFVRK